jgi:hypothetical protein
LQTHSKNALGTWKVSTWCASATTGPELGLTSPSDMVLVVVGEAAFGAFKRRKRAGKSFSEDARKAVLDFFDRRLPALRTSYMSQSPGKGLGGALRNPRRGWRLWQGPKLNVPGVCSEKKSLTVCANTNTGGDVCGSMWARSGFCRVHTTRPQKKE